jgi:uncharacterized protein YbjT (DUF2867 family)
MKVVVGGAFGNLGLDVLRSCIEHGYETVAIDMMERPVDGLDPESYVFHQVNASDPATLKGVCDGADAVITTIGLTKGSPTVTPMDVDYLGNLNLLNEAISSGVKKFIYVSVLLAKEGSFIPMLGAKAKMEDALTSSGIDYVIYRPTGYFYDIMKQFKPMIEKGSVTLLGHDTIHANVIDTRDFADYMVEHINDTNKIVNIGGQEVYSYEEIARMCFDAAGKKPDIRHAPVWTFDLISKLPKVKKEGRSGVVQFGKWVMTHQMVGDTKAGKKSFKEYIYQSFRSASNDSDIKQ